MAAGDEVVVIVDDENRVVGSASRSEMRRLRLPHRSTYILVFNSRGELFVQKRTLTKDIFPGYFDVAAGGVVLQGESYEEGAARELAEELGIRDVPLESLFQFYYVDSGVKVWGAVFACTYDGEMVLQEEEIESGSFVPFTVVLERAKNEPFTPDGMYVLKRFLKSRTRMNSDSHVEPGSGFAGPPDAV
jgi:8-oxo-dGTP pyrophosphatase MutT (NUDIX family)